MNNVFTMKTLLLLSSIIHCSLYTTFSALAQPPVHFRMQRISLETYESVGAFDVNGDQKPDLVSGAFWYEGPAFIKKHPIGEVKRVGEYYDDFSTLPVDANGDGKLDFVTGGWWGGNLRWRENPLAFGQDPAIHAAIHEWPDHVLGTCGNVETTRAWDVDGDGHPEFAPNTPGFPFKFFRLNRDAAGKPLGTFTEHKIYDAKQGHGLGFGDINGDGRNDFVLPGGWLEAPVRPLTDAWAWHPDFSLGTTSVPIIVTDVNGDGRTDLIAGQGHSYGLDWYEQLPNRTWKKHAIDPNHSQFHEMQWVDLDGDRKPELLTGKRYRAHNDNDPGSHDDYGLYYYQWNGENFVKQVICYGAIGQTKGTGIQLAVTDLNADGKPDIAVAGKDGLSVFFNEGVQP